MPLISELTELYWKAWEGRKPAQPAAAIEEKLEEALV